MAPAVSPAERERVGPHPSHIEVAKPYILQSRIQKCLFEINMSDAKEDAVRLQGVAWIDQVRRALQLPIRTFNTAVIYYHKFRLLHGDNEYNWADASAAALFTACKIEDTLKKSREILCANWNLKVAASESLSSDDPRFENHSKLIIGLERLMLESAGFDFRNRYPQKLMVKLARALKFDRNNASKTAWNLSVDLYKTFAPLKQTTPTLAIACIELAARLHDMDTSRIVDTGVLRYTRWATSRAEVMETLLDLLDLYTHHRGSTAVGPLYTLETFIEIRIGLNQEASAANIPRFALYSSEATAEPQAVANGLKPRNGIDPTSPLTPATPGTISPNTNQAPTSALGVRGQNGTVRFMLDAARARDEHNEVDKYHKIEEEEYEVEVPNDARPDDRDKRSREPPRVHHEHPQRVRDIDDSITQLAGQARKTSITSSYWNKYRQRIQAAKEQPSDYEAIPGQDERGLPIGHDEGLSEPEPQRSSHLSLYNHGSSVDSSDTRGPGHTRNIRSRDDRSRSRIRGYHGYGDSGDYEKQSTDFRRSHSSFRSSYLDTWGDSQRSTGRYERDGAWDSVGRYQRERSVDSYDGGHAVRSTRYRGRGRGRANHGRYRDGKRGGHERLGDNTSLGFDRRRLSVNSECDSRPDSASHGRGRCVEQLLQDQNNHQQNDRKDHVHEQGPDRNRQPSTSAIERDTALPSPGADRVTIQGPKTFVHPDRLNLVSAQNDHGQGFSMMENSPPRYRKAERSAPYDPVSKSVKQPTSEIRLVTTKTEHVKQSARDSVSPARHRGLSAEDGHQWTHGSTNDGRSRGQGRDRGRGHARGDRGRGRGRGWYEMDGAL